MQIYVRCVLYVWRFGFVMCCHGSSEMLDEQCELFIINVNINYNVFP